MLQLLFALLLATPAAGWILFAQDVYGASLDTIKRQMRGDPNLYAPQAQLGELWSMDLPGVTPQGWSMGGGITWAWDPDLCDRLMDRFSEDMLLIKFIVCEDAKAAVSRAFDKWGANNRNLKFSDVSEECARLPNNGKDSGLKLVSTPDTSFTYHNQCPLAEIYVSFLDPDEVRTDVLQVAVATAYSKDVSRHANTSMVFTNGVRPYKLNSNGQRDYNAPFYATYSGTLKFDVTDRNCWYLDSAFCVRFHRYKESMGGPAQGRITLTLICWAIVLVAFIAIVMKCCGCCGCIALLRKRKTRAADRDGDGKLSWEERWLFLVEEISTWNPLLLSVLWMCIISPPLVLTYIFLPCWDCSDFEAAALHEIGHLIGLGHPDAAPEGLHPQVSLINPNPVAEQAYQPTLAAGGRINATNCFTLWEDVQYGVPPGLPTDQYLTGSQGYETRRSVMQAFTQHNPTACLENDDVDALTMMYPDCSAQAHSVNICHKINHNIGLVRLMTYWILPLLLSMVIIITCSGIASSYLNKELEEAREQMEQQEEEIAEVKTKVKAGRGASILADSSVALHDAAKGSRAAELLLKKRQTAVHQDYTFGDGPMGLVLGNMRPIIKAVEPNTPAAAQSVLQGGMVVRINGESFSGNAAKIIAGLPRPVTLTVEYTGKQSEALKAHPPALEQI